MLHSGAAELCHFNMSDYKDWRVSVVETEDKE